MSNNLGQFAGGKNPAWGRNNNPPNMVPQNNQGLNMPQMMNQMGNMNNTAVLQFQQQHPQVFQNALGIQQQNLGIGLQQMANNALGASQLTSNQIFQQVSSVSYPNPRALNTAAFQTPQNMPPISQMSGNNTNTKQRVFTGTVTKVHDNFGFVDEEVFFQTNACSKGLNPSVGDRVLVEASYNPSMPFKWNATRIQVLPTSSGNSNQQQSSRHTSSSSSSKNYNSSGYNAVPPPDLSSNFSSNSRNNNNSRPKASVGGRGRERSRDRDREDEEIERKRRREERQREREKEEKKSPVRRRSRSPKVRRRPRIVPRYMVQIPKIALNLFEADVLEVRRRYANMYIPSDFFHTNFEWTKAFPSNKPFSLSKPCSYHIMSKEAESVVENDAVLEPPDCDYLFSAKVMLINVPGMDELYTKCCAMAEDEDKKDRDVDDKDYIHPSRLISFLVGLRGKNETMAIGGPWSPSLDGPNPEKDPSVLIRTAIRTCKALTGIDLSNCTQWYRFVELYYHRSESVHKAKTVPARIETVVVYLPDVWSCLPTSLEWDNLVQSYQKVLERELTADAEPTDEPQPDEKEEDQMDKVDPTHYSHLDVKTMTVNDLKRELNARNASVKGLKSQLVARLGKLLKAEAEQDAGEPKEGVEDAEPEAPAQEEKKPEVEEKKPLDEKEKAALQKRYTLPEQQHIIVHPSKTAKSGKFDCTVMSLSLLLDYRPDDTKEHFFEVSIFAELFNEMLMRDFGFNIYKALHQLPEKPKEKEEPKKRDKDDRKGEDKKKPDDKKKEEDKKKDGDKKEDDEKQPKEEDKEKKSEDSKESKDKDKKCEKKSETKKSDRKSYDSDEDKESDEDDDKDRKKDKDKKKTRVKLYTKHKHLLLSFVYFDQTHCGYIFDKDIEDLLNNLGLSLSRAQIRKLVGKVVTRDSLHYRKLTDKAKDEESPIKEELEESVVKELAVGNNKLLPVFVAPKENDGGVETASTTEVKSSEGMVMFQGALVDVGKLMLQLERSDKARIEADSRVTSLKNENNKLNEKYDKANQQMKRMNSELKEYKEKFRNSEDTLSKTLAYSKLFQTTLTEIRDKIDPVLKSTSINKEENMKKEKEADRDKKDKDEGKSRWEKDVKTEMEVDESTDEKTHSK